MNKLMNTFSLNDITRGFVVGFVVCRENNISKTFTNSLKTIHDQTDYNKIRNETICEILKKILDDYVTELYMINPDDVDGLDSIYSDMCSMIRFTSYGICTASSLTRKIIYDSIECLITMKEKIHSIILLYFSGLPYDQKNIIINDDVIELSTVKGNVKVHKYELKIDYDKCQHDKDFVYNWVSDHSKDLHFIMKYVYSNYFMKWSNNQYMRVDVNDCNTCIIIRLLCAKRVSDISLYISREQHNDNIIKIDKIDDIIERTKTITNDDITSFVMNMDIYTTIEYSNVFKVDFNEKIYHTERYGINEYKLFIKYVVHEYMYRIYNMRKYDVYRSMYDKITALFINKNVRKYFSETDVVNPYDIKKMVCEILIENKRRISTMLYIGHNNSIFTNTFTVEKTLYRGNKYKDKTLYDSITLTIPVVTDVNAVKEWIMNNRSSFNKLLEFQLSIETEYYNYLKLCKLTLHQGLLEAKFCFKIEDMCG